MIIEESGMIEWEQEMEIGTRVHAIHFSATILKNELVDEDADGNRGRRVSYVENTDYEYPPGITKEEKAEIDSLIEDEIEMLGLHLEL